jgi:oxidoreductase family protein
LKKPQAPREPDPQECCGKGCTPCVFDVYAEALQRYRTQLEEFNRARAKDANLKNPN